MNTKYITTNIYVYFPLDVINLITINVSVQFCD